MADLLHIAIELKQQSELLALGRCILHQNLVLIQGLLQNLCAETLRHHRQLQVTFVAHVVADGVIGIAVRIEGGRLTVGVKGKGNRTGHRHRRCKGNGAVLCNGQLGIMHVADIELDLVFLVSHILYPHFHIEISNENKTSYSFSLSIHVSVWS